MKKVIGYVCKYTPLEILKAFGETPVMLCPKQGLSDEISLSLFHNNMCSYAKAALQAVIEQEIDEIVLTTCCDSIERLYDVLQTRVKFAYIIDLPRKTDQEAIKLYTKALKDFINTYSEYKKTSFNWDLFQDIWYEEYANRVVLPNKYIALAGARFDEEILNWLEKRTPVPVVNLSCTGKLRLGKWQDNEDLLQGYSESLLNSYPCKRMFSARDHFLSARKPQGIIYNTISFCDFYGFEYAKLKRETEIPLVKIETDYSSSISGQIATRIDAFLETLDIKEKNTKGTGHYFAGIDSGSTSTNAVIVDAEGKILGYGILPTGAKPTLSARLAFEEALKKAGIQEDEIADIVATGYGRISIPFASRAVTEITCHGKGAFYCNNSVRSIIDIGGQDSKAIRLDDNGNVIDFVMNDKCSAGTGRFLELMAEALEIPLEEIGENFDQEGPNEEITITSMCTVFAQSEVVSLVAQNKDQRDIIFALNRSVASKAISLLDRIGRESAYMMTGGVAKNAGVVLELEKHIGEKLIIPEEPQIIGAYGAALIASGK